MTRTTDWSSRVLALLKGGNTAASLAQIKAAPSVKDIRQLRTAIATAHLTGRWPDVDVTISDQIDALSAPRLHRSP